MQENYNNAKLIANSRYRNIRQALNKLRKVGVGRFLAQGLFRSLSEVYDDQTEESKTMIPRGYSRFILMTMTGMLLLVLPAAASAQGRGHGWGRGGRDQSWKCGKFVNCHDARDGRVDGLGPNRTSGVWRNGVFYPRGSRVRYGRYGSGRYSTNDYWRRRHVMNDDDNWRRRRVMNDSWTWDNSGRYRNRRWRHD